MAPRVDPVQSEEVLPAQADVVVIGGGIIGTSTALFLAQKGISVALCEKGHIAGEQSSRNWGWCRKMVRDPREIPLIIESLRLWERMNETVEAETGFRTCGIMYLGETEAELAQLEGWLDHAPPASTTDWQARRPWGRAAAIEGAGLGDAYREGRWRAGDIGLGRSLRLSQADGWRHLQL